MFDKADDTVVVQESEQAMAYAVGGVSSRCIVQRQLQQKC